MEDEEDMTLDEDVKLDEEKEAIKKEAIKAWEEFERKFKNELALADYCSTHKSEISDEVAEKKIIGGLIRHPDYFERVRGIDDVFYFDIHYRMYQLIKDGIDLLKIDEKQKQNLILGTGYSEEGLEAYCKELETMGVDDIKEMLSCLDKLKGKLEKRIELKGKLYK